ncbi:hypothetical protein QR680_000895 [Steinernema hermaphroditum]|uniref:BPL/LPL catalytic domain-containing protein n=1 Tax=Steinernema hermaphroditum TaxID=289476 RepID=A0AA39GW99_9BILA|nr:hypothetical protein QR680_000895 [Steinernema hermaphroditum]
MFFFAWSLVISAVNSARRRRLLAALARCFDESEGATQPISILCQQINLAPLKGLWKSSSESILHKNAQFGDCVIYQSETREILAVTCEDILKTEEWRMLIDPSTPRRHPLQQRIWFVAELSPLAKTSGGGSVCVELEDGKSSFDEGASDTQSYASTSELTDNASDESLAISSAGSFSPILVNQMCKTIAYSRDNPWKVLYECSFQNFFEIAFHWSEDALLALNGTATVSNLATVRLPENFFSSNAMSELLCNADSQLTSTNSLSVSTPTLSLLELLYWNEFGNGPNQPVDMRTMSVGTLPSPLLGTDCTPMVNGVAYFQAPTQKALPAIASNSVALREPALAFTQAMDTDRSSASAIDSSLSEPRSIAFMDAESPVSCTEVDLLNGSAHKVSVRANSKERTTNSEHSVQGTRMNHMEVVEVRPTSINLLQIKEESPMSNNTSSNSFELADYGAYCGTRICEISQQANGGMNGSLKRLNHIASNSHLCAMLMMELEDMENLLLVYTGDNEKLFELILKQMTSIISLSQYNVEHVLAETLRSSQWVSRKTACLLMASTEGLDDSAWLRLQDYFSHCGKIIFVCQNNLLAGLSSCQSLKKQTNLLKLAFGKRQSKSLGKDFENFLKRAVKVLSKSKEINETYHARDFIGGYKYSVHLCKEEDSPMFMYMENTAQQASALFSDATTDELMSDGGHKLIRDALCRLGIKTIENNAECCGRTGYLICAHDQISGIVERLSFTDPIGEAPKLLFRRQSAKSGAEENGTDNVDLVTIVVCTRSGIQSEFDDVKYFSTLKTKSLGKSIICFAKCPSTLSISQSLSKGLRGYDGIVVVALEQDDISGRNGAIWTSPKGCPTFSFDFNVPVNSNLGRSIEFAQHILTLSIVQALKGLLGEEFPAKIKWPNDVYYKKKSKLASVFVQSSVRDKYVICLLSGAVNVSNKFPFGCINELIGEEAHKLSSEEVIACVMNKFEMLVNLLERKGVEVFLKEYLSHWLHKDEEVYMLRKESVKKEKVVIRGLDHTGHLILQNKKSDEVFCIAEKGYSFDVSRKFIRYIA